MINDQVIGSSFELDESESQASPLMTVDGTPYDIPEEGSLGLLAMGYAGIMLWREKRQSSSEASAGKD